MGGEPDPEPPAAPPVIILSENSSNSGPQLQEQDPDSAPHPHTSLSQSHFQTQKKRVSRSLASTSSTLNPKPEPEPHPAPPVIILSHNKRAASSFLSGASSPALWGSRISDGTVTRDRLNSALRITYVNHRMGSKASKVLPKDGKLQSSQEKKDKEEMKEPTNYYTHRSKSLRRKADKEANSSGAGGISLGSGGAGGAI